MQKTLKRSPLRDRWRRRKASGIPVTVRLSWALEDASVTHPVLTALFLAILVAAAGWLLVTLVMILRHP